MCYRRRHQHQRWVWIDTLKDGGDSLRLYSFSLRVREWTIMPSSISSTVTLITRPSLTFSLYLAILVDHTEEGGKEKLAIDTMIRHEWDSNYWHKLTRSDEFSSQFHSRNIWYVDTIDNSVWRMQWYQRNTYSQLEKDHTGRNQTALLLVAHK